MAKVYKVIARSVNDKNYERIIGVFKTEDEAKQKINLWENYGPYDFMGQYELHEEVV